MNTRRNWRRGLIPFALAALALPSAGCDEAGIPNPADDLCCTDFEVGADLSAADWGIENVQANATFSAFMQATADFAGVTTAVVNDVAAACQAIALDTGAAEDAVTATDAAGRAAAWCQLAVTQINTVVKANGSVTIKAQPPSCELSVSAQANCEAKCTANVMCEAELGDISARCDPAQLSGKCSAECSGSCEGSANLAVSCEGTCQGTCEGTCSGACSNGTGADCRGDCEGTCNGQCRGTCAVEAGANVQCEGSCTGECSVELQAPRCKAELTPPSAECSGEAECSGSCKASASAKAECRPGSVEVVATGTVDVRHIASLKLNLPKILMIAQARGELLFQNASALVSLSADLVVRAPDLSVKAGLCALPAAAALATAADNLEASVSASASITGALGM